MNYEYLKPTKRSSGRTHIAAEGHDYTLCGRGVDRDSWRKSSKANGVCSRCSELLKQIAGGNTSAPLKLISLKLTPRQYHVLSKLRQGVPMNEIFGNRSLASRHVQRVCETHGITVPELRMMLPHIRLIDPKLRRKKPDVYFRPQDGTYEVHCDIDGKRKYIGRWVDEREALAAWRASEKGLPVQRPPKKEPKPYYITQDGRYRVQIYHKQSKKRLNVGSFHSEAEALEAREHAMKHGIYTSQGLVKITS